MPSDLGIPGLRDATEIGRGGFSIVYKARQEQYDRVVAVKVLQVGETDEASRRRFLRELATAGSVSDHPHVVPVYDSGFTSDGLPFLVMPFFSGGSLSSFIGTGQVMPWREAAEVGIKIAGALASAHLRGVVHRDVKPHNILVSQYGEPALADFGIARLAGQMPTRTADSTWTIAYAAPELLRGEEAAPATDVYSLAATLISLVRGLPPSMDAPEDSAAAVTARILDGSFTEVGSIPGAVQKLLQEAMSPAISSRPSAAEFGAGLARVLATVEPSEWLVIPRTRQGGTGLPKSRRRRRARRTPVILALGLAVIAAALLGAGAAGLVPGLHPAATTVTVTLTPPPTLLHPEALALATSGPGKVAHVYVADFNEIWDAGSGHLTLIAGQETKGDGPDGGAARDARLSHPKALFALPDGGLLVSDSGNNKIKKIRADGTIVTIAGTGKAETRGDGGPADVGSFNYPTGIASCPDGTLYVVDNVFVRRIDAAGQHNISTYAGSSDANAPAPTDGSSALTVALSGPTAIACDAKGTMFMADNYAVWSEGANKKLHLVAGSTGTTGKPAPDAAASAALFNDISSLLVAPDGTIYVADDINNVVEAIHGGRVTIIAGDQGRGVSPCSGDALNAEIDSPLGIAFADAPARLYIADTYNRRVLLLPLTAGTPASRQVSTVYDTRKC